MDSFNEGPTTARRWLRYSLSSILILMTLACLLLGWRHHVRAEENALDQLRTELDDYYLIWQNPKLRRVTPIEAEYSWTVKMPDGTTKTETRYHDNSYLIDIDWTIHRPTPHLTHGWLTPNPRYHVYGVLLPSYNVKDENLALLRRLPNLKYVIVRGIYEPENSQDPTLTAVRKALLGVEVLGEICKLHPENAADR